jgi:hypothetical protein
MRRQRRRDLTAETLNYSPLSSSVIVSIVFAYFSSPHSNCRIFRVILKSTVATTAFA